MPERILRLLVGLIAYGFGCALTVAAGLGVDPWTVFAEGLARVTGIGVGWITNIVGLGVLLLWIPLRQKPGVGTVANILLVGTSMQVALGAAWASKEASWCSAGSWGERSASEQWSSRSGSAPWFTSLCRSSRPANAPPLRLTRDGASAPRVALGGNARCGSVSAPGTPGGRCRA
ncbi:MAG: putative rane protein [Microbacterium sp.]|nr:putative rane protein [Microbacterium sp.]